MIQAYLLSNSTCRQINSGIPFGCTPTTLFGFCSVNIPIDSQVMTALCTDDIALFSFSKIISQVSTMLYAHYTPGTVRPIEILHKRNQIPQNSLIIAKQANLKVRLTSFYDVWCPKQWGGENSLTESNSILARKWHSRLFFIKFLVSSSDWFFERVLPMNVSFTLFQT